MLASTAAKTRAMAQIGNLDSIHRRRPGFLTMRGRDYGAFLPQIITVLRIPAPDRMPIPWIW